MEGEVKKEEAMTKMGLNEAMAKAQAEFEPPAKTKMVKGRTYDFYYADLDAIVTAWKKVFPKYGISFRQSILGNVLTTTICCGDESVDCTVPFPDITNKSPQEAGSVMTYYKRYGFCAAFGIVAEDDDDGEAAKDTKFKASAPKAKPSPIAEAPKAPEDRMAAFYERKSLHIDVAKAGGMTEWMKKMEQVIQHAPTIKAVTNLQADNEDTLNLLYEEDRAGYDFLMGFVKSRNAFLSQSPE
jgi:hypothetical protein